MADSFFGFDTTLNREECGEELDPDEQEYDALNDETFGCVEDTNGSLDDWEAQHEQLAEIAENARRNHKLEDSISRLVSEDDNDKPSEVDLSIWTATKPNNIERKYSRNETENNIASVFNQNKIGIQTNGISLPKNVCTVEELERGLLTNQKPSVPPPPLKTFPPNYGPGPQNPPSRFPPGLGPVLLPPSYLPPGMSHVPPNMLRFLPPHPLLMQHGMPLPPHNSPSQANRALSQTMPNMNLQQKNLISNTSNTLPGIRGNYPGHPHNFNNFRPDYQTTNFQPFNSNVRPYHTHLNNQHLYNRSNNNRNNLIQKPQITEVQDEYAGLMTNREKQWLLNIQLLQLNTGTPYFDDFYYTVFIDRQAKLEKENRPNFQDHTYPNHRNYNQNNRYNISQNNRKDGYFHKDGNIGHRERDRNHAPRNDRDSNQTQINRVYTPLQFENSLGKLQCGSVTAPRKIIDMDVVAHDKDSDISQLSLNTQRDVRKTKQTLLELESLFGLILRLEDLSNPLAIANNLKLREIKEKQKIQQLENATPEEKEDILKQLQGDSLVRTDSKEDLLNKLLVGLLNEDKFQNYIAIRKGKVFLLRLLPYLDSSYYSEKLLEIWSKLLLSIPTIGKRDLIGDNILPQFFHHFDRCIGHANFEFILSLVSSLTDTRNETVHHPFHGKPVLYYIMSNKFGISCITKIIEKGESLFNNTYKDHHKWPNFLSSILEIFVQFDIKPEVPMQFISRPMLETHLKQVLSNKYDNYDLFLNIFCEKISYD